MWPATCWCTDNGGRRLPPRGQPRQGRSAALDTIDTLDAVEPVAVSAFQWARTRTVRATIPEGETRLPGRCMESTGERCFATPGPTAGQGPGRWVNPAFLQRDARCRGAPFSSRFDPHFDPGLAHGEHDSSVSSNVAREAFAAAAMQDVPTYDPTRSKVLQSRYVDDARRKQSLQTGQCSTKGKGVRCVREHGRTAQCEPVSVPLSRTQPGRSFHEQDSAVASAQCASTSSPHWALFDYDEVKTSQHGQSSAKPGWRYSKADTWNEAGYLPADGLRSPRTRL